MSKFRLGGSLLGILALFFLTNCHEFNNPVDEAADNYIGFEVLDLDNDGVPSYQDVDDIYPIFPEDGWTFTALPVSLSTNEVDTTKIYKFKVQLATNPEFCDCKELYFKTNTFHVLPVNPCVGENYYWHVKSYDGRNWSVRWSATRSFRIRLDNLKAVEP